MDKLIKDIRNFIVYASKFLKIKDKNQQIVPFKFNKSQLIIEEVRAYCQKYGLLERYIILKARQKGISTYFEALVDWITSTTRNTKAVVIGHVEDASKNLFEMVQRYYKFKPEHIRPKTQYSNEKKLKYIHLDSEVKVKTAGVSGEGTGRSDTINILHVTELAFWNDARQSLLGILQAVPDAPNTLVALESTANGIGDEFYNRWQKVYSDPDRIEIIPNIAWRSKTSRFVCIFISWLIDDEYTLAFDNDEVKSDFSRSINETEKVLTKYGATFEHLNWRRFAIEDKCGGDTELFKQEYPSTPEEAFLVSGRPVFDVLKCQMNQIQARQSTFKRGNLDPIYKTDDEKFIETLNSERNSYYDLLPYLKGVKFVPSETGFIKLWDFKPIEKSTENVFAAGYDVAEGLEQGDYSSGSYLDRRTNKVILEWHGHIDPDLLAVEQHKISVYLKGKDTVCTERNNQGLTTVTNAERLKVRQYNYSGFNGKNITDVINGFKTTPQTKPIIIQDLNEYIREGLFVDYGEDFWKECLTYVKNDKGQTNAQGKDKDTNSRCYDDRVMNRALMIRCHKEMRPFVNYDEEDTPYGERARAINYNSTTYDESSL